MTADAVVAETVTPANQDRKKKNNFPTTFINLLNRTGAFVRSFQFFGSEVFTKKVRCDIINEMKEKKVKKKSFLRHLRWGGWLSVLLTALIGVLLLILPEGKPLSAGMGILLLATGALFLVSAFLNGRSEFIQLVFAIAAIGLAIWLLASPESAVPMLGYIFGAILLLRALLGVLASFSAQRTGGSWWKIQLVGALIIAVFAIVLFFDPFETQLMISLVGICMILNAFLELITFFRRLFIKPKEEEEKTKKGKKKKEKKEKEEQE